MGMPSDKKRSARRPSQTKRAHIKRVKRVSTTRIVPSGGHERCKLGLKKRKRFIGWLVQSTLSNRI